MESVLYQIYLNRFGTERREAYDKRFGAALDTLRTRDPALAEQFAGLLEAQSKETQYKACEMFAEGFSMAVRLMTETLTGI